jgi:hypothetical protein
MFYIASFEQRKTTQGKKKQEKHAANDEKQVGLVGQ